MGKLKETLKQWIPKRWLYYAKTNVEIPRYLRIIKNIRPEKDVSSVFLLGTPLHENLGDHLIAQAELAFLCEAGFQRVTEIPYEIFCLYGDKLRQSIPKTALICITGGGWMGNLYPNDERFIQRVLRLFHENKIVILPQTIYYDENLPDAESLRQGMRKCCRLCSDLTMCFRELASYEFAVKHFQDVGANILLVPDMALYLKGQLPEKEREKKGTDVALCFRKDREAIAPADIKKTMRFFIDKGMTCSTIDTICLCRIPSCLRERVLRRTLKAFRRPSLIITNRLHGMIFSYLAGTPCIAMDNRTKKISGVYQKWLKRESGIVFCDSLNEAIDTALAWKPSDDCACQDFSFDKLKGVIHGEN